MTGALHLEEDLQALERGYHGSRHGTSDTTSAKRSDYRLRDKVFKLATVVRAGVLGLDIFRALEDLSQLL